MRQQFVTLLRSRIKAHWVIHLIVRRIRYFLIGAIDGTGRSVNEVFYANVNLNLNFGCAFFIVIVRVSVIIGMAAGFEDVIETDEVGLDVSVGIGDAIAHASLGSQVHDNMRLIFGEDSVDEGAVGYIAADESKR